MSYGYENGYGSGAPDDPSTQASSQQYGYESGYGSGSSNQVTPTDVELGALGAASTTLNQMAPWNVLRAHTIQPVADAVAEEGGKLGYPKTGAAVGTAIAISPEILSAYTALKGIYNSPNPTVQGLVNTPKELSPQYAAQNEAIGIYDRVPETASKVAYENPQQYPSQLSNVRYRDGVASTTGARMPTPKPMTPPEPLPSTVPIKYPDDPGTLINQANSRISTHGANLTPQELSDYKNLLQTKMANGEIPKFDPNGKITQIFAQASQAVKNVTNTLNQVAEPLLQNAKLPDAIMPTREGLNQAYRVASIQQGATDLIKKYGLRLAEGGLGALGMKQLYDHFRK